MKKKTDTLPLHEQLLLLGLDDDKGSVVFSASTGLPYALAGALIMHLIDEGALAYIDNTLRALRSRTGDGVEEDVLALVRASSKPRSIDYWVSKIPNKVKKFRDRIAASLVDRGILREDRREFLWVFEYSRFPEVDSRPEQAILKKLRDVVLKDVPPDEEAIKLLSLVRAAELVNEVFGRGERRDARRRIKELTRDEKVGTAVASTVAAMNAAVMTAVISAAAASAAASSSS